ncbi:MAG: NADPH:quinone oxidoreductase [Pseudomonadales bacterium]|nr:NADPH:quinone oxidoreductase [Pseudomonadales bacterium]HAG92968.1 NADPH:quinone oxidoreductase [Gammaproteobacteria bacterium]HAU12518.1 NADPH:quinone oxidoreductase [Gammaproteobacteria bacterium]HBO92336.1 NADPH:quinone oxidoreductase [Gammaproteobacteria bacterium]|tara:strand:- start:18475 stop:19536 length:1062 start_codon:yes stop_codon:yes gene_type:complete
MKAVMKGVVIHRYGSAADVLNIEAVTIPEPRANEVLIRQHATSVNPIDYRMRSGYGHVLLAKMRGFELPLILGRDVAGEVVKVGPKVTELQAGDAVFGVPSPKAQGTYAEYVISTPAHVIPMPKLPESEKPFSFEQAASLPYVTCTVWDALVTKAGLGPGCSSGKKVFVQGGSGGIGALAIQLLKYWGAYVATTCSTANMKSVAALGADLVIDYTSEDYSRRLSGFDVALETVGGPLEEKTLGILRSDGKAVFVTLIHPILQTFDESGLVWGAIRNLSQFRKQKCRAGAHGIQRYYWSTFKPSVDALTTVRYLIEEGRLQPHIDRTFSLTDIITAHEYCEQGKANGKVVINVE